MKTLRLHHARKLALAALFSMSGCAATLDDPSRFSDGGAAATSSPDGGVACGDVPTRVLAASCGSAGCHGATSPASALDLASPGVGARLLGKPSSHGELLVDPSSPQTSALYTKTGAAPSFGSRMPLAGTPLDDATRACLLGWIGSLGGSPAVPLDAGGAGDAAGPSNDAGSVVTAPALANAVLWLDASQSVTLAGARVSAWSDHSGSHNDALQTDDAHRPTVAVAAIAGLPALRFEESRETFLAVTDAASLQFGTGGFTIAVVVANRKRTAGRGHGGGVSTVVAKPQLPGTAPEIAMHLNWFTGETTDDGTKIHFGLGEGLPGLESTSDGYADGVARLYVTRVTSNNGMNIELRVGAKSVGTSHAQAVGVSLVGQPLRIGSTYGQSVEGDVGEVVVVKGGISDGDLGKLEAYLIAKYKLSI